jgi:hypothetical protein
VFSSEISHHALPSCLCHRIPIRLSQAAVVSLFPDRRVACTRWGTCFMDRRVRVMPRFSGLVCGSWVLLGVLGDGACKTQAMIGSFSGDGS